MHIKIRCNLEYWIFNIILTYSFVNAFLSTFFIGYVNKYVIFIMILMFFYCNRYIVNKSKAAFITFNFCVVFYILYNFVGFGFSQIISSDFYNFLLFAFMMVVVSNKGVRHRFLQFFVNHFNKYFFTLCLFWAVVVISILFQDGLKKDLTTVLPILYGPYEVPHSFGYALVAIYCALSLYQIETHAKNKILYVIRIICVVGTVWTAARSAVLAMAIVLCADFIGIKKRSTKIVIFSLACIVGLYLVSFTDVLYNNPLIQKTISATDAGSITNGRERFATILMTYYKSNNNQFQKLFGIGMHNLRTVMGLGKVGKIHAHNDYVNTLVGYGFVGLVVYCYFQLKIFLSNNNWLYSIMLQSLIFILAFYNGIAMYTSFTVIFIYVVLFFDRISNNRKG